MTAFRMVVRAIGGAVLLAATAGALPAQMGDPKFNARINTTDGWCSYCPGVHVGNNFECPCRINDPIIIS